MIAVDTCMLLTINETKFILSHNEKIGNNIHFYSIEGPKGLNFATRG